MKLPKMNLEADGDDPAEIGSGKNGNLPADARARATINSDLIPDDLQAGAIDALRDCLKATRRYWDKDERCWQIEPDYQARLKAAELTLAYKVGRPVERKFEVRGNLDTFEQQKERLLKSAEGIRFLLAAGAINAQEAAEALSQTIEAPEV